MFLDSNEARQRFLADEYDVLFFQIHAIPTVINPVLFTARNKSARRVADIVYT